MLPWENEGGVVYTARELRPRKRWVTYGGYCFAALLLAAGILTRFRIALLFGALYILALLMGKHVVVSEEGIEQFYQMRITTHYECYPWNEIDTVLLEDRGHPTLAALYFRRGDKTKRLFFDKEDAEKILLLARKQNSTIRIERVEKK